MSVHWLDSWRGIIISKYSSMAAFGEEVRTVYVIELFSSSESTRQVRLNHSEWSSLKIGEYVLKKALSPVIDQRAIKKKEAEAATDYLVKQLSNLSQKVRQRAAEGLKYMNTFEARKALRAYRQGGEKPYFPPIAPDTLAQIEKELEAYKRKTGRS